MHELVCVKRMNREGHAHMACHCVFAVSEWQSFSAILPAAGAASVADRVLCHTAGGNHWTSSRPSHVWQNRSTAFDPHLTHADTPFHAAMQRLVLLHALASLVDLETLIAQRRYIDYLHARQLRNECSMTGTLHLAELNEVVCRDDAQVSALSTWCCPPRSCGRQVAALCHLWRARSHAHHFGA